MTGARGGRRSGCGPLAFLLVGALLAVLLIGGDRLAQQYAERQVTAQLRAELGMSSNPEVDIHGFPFLTQVAANRFGRVDVAGRGVHLVDGAQQLTLDSVRFSLTDVVTADSYRRVTAGTLDGTTMLGWAETSRLFRFPLAKGEGDRVLIDASQTVYGQRIKLEISGQPVIDPAQQTFTLGDARAEVGGFKVPDSIVRSVLQDIVRPTPLTLPLGLRVTSAHAVDSGLEIGLTGRDVPLTR